MTKRIEVKAGDRYGRYTVLREVDTVVAKGGSYIRSFECQCDCGNIRIVRLCNLRHSKSEQLSCGCYRKEKSGNREYYHHLSNTHIYSAWYNMKVRCYYTKQVYYKRYGGRGIKVCDEWKNSFKSFYEWAINNGYKDGLSLDRIDNDGNYEPSNCRWVSMKRQNRNRCNNVILEKDGIRIPVIDFFEYLGIDYKSNIRKISWIFNEYKNQAINSVKP